jgi:hypothetical protein
MFEGELSTHRDIQAGVPQGSILAPTAYSLYINDIPQTPGVYLALFADDTCIYTTDRKEGHVLRKLQRGLTSMESWCEHWNIKINEDTTQAIYYILLPQAKTGPGLSYNERTAKSLCKQRGISQCNFW